MERTKQLHVFIKPELHKWLKVEAAKQGRSVTDLLEEILETEIEKIQKRYVLHNNLKSRKAYFFYIYLKIIIRKDEDRIKIKDYRAQYGLPLARRDAHLAAHSCYVNKRDISKSFAFSYH